jgi:hypothetical protein
MGRQFEMLAYGVVAMVLVGASLYGLARYADSAAPAAPEQAAYVLPHPLTSSAVPATAPPPAVAVPQNVVRTSNKTYYLTPTSQAQADVDTYNSLRNNCYANASNNSEGEFPALQQAACDRFANFARSRGWDTGPLPGYGTPRPKEVGQQVAIVGQSEPIDEGQCASLYEREQYVEAALRSGYQEPLGNRLRAEQRELLEQLWRLHCPRR